MENTHIVKKNVHIMMFIFAQTRTY